MEFFKYTNKTLEEIFKELNASFSGFANQEIELRQKRDGLNEIKSGGVNIGSVLSRQLKSPFAYLLLAAAILAFIIGEKIDFFVIASVVLINVLLGFFQEYRAERAIYLLKKYISHNVKVLRQSKEELIDKKNLVVGDIVLLEAGDRVQADLRIIKVENFLVDESALTGESVPASKCSEPLSVEVREVFEAKNILFAGTSVISGKAECIVINIGENTAFGKIAEMVSNAHQQSSYEKDIVYFCRLVLKIVLATIAFIFVANVLIKGVSSSLEFILFCIALIVSILPEALPAVVTFSLSKGSLIMAKRHAVVRRLSAIEDMGNIDILCTDKTGTLTENKLSLQKVVSSNKRNCLLYGLLASGINDRKHSILNPFDLALFDKSPDDFWREYKKYSMAYELPFDSSKMRSGFVIKHKNGQQYLIVKGAPEVVLDFCGRMSDRSSKKEIKEDVEKEGREGKRVLAVAYKKISKSVVSLDNEKNMIFLGYFVFEDPLKNSALEAMSLARKLGVKIKIITGDSKEVAGYVAQKVKLIKSTSEVISSAELEKMMPDEFEDACRERQVFSRISPALKYKIVKSLQKEYNVGFLGEGINDAPALKIANVGIVVQSASDVSREVSDVVLLRRDLRVVIEAIQLGRNIYSNINKYIKCTLASNFGNFYSVAVISLFIKFLPMLPAQILLANLLSDFPLISVATDSVDTEELKKPRAYQLNKVLPLIITLALISTTFDFIFFAIFYRQAPGVIQTLWFIESVLTELVLIFSIRTMHLAWRAKKPGFPLVFLSILSGAVVATLPFFAFGQKFFHFASPPIASLLIVFFLVVIYFIVSEAAKLIYFRYWRTKNSVLN